MKKLRCISESWSLFSCSREIEGEKIIPSFDFSLSSPFPSSDPILRKIEKSWSVDTYVNEAGWLAGSSLGGRTKFCFYFVEYSEDIASIFCLLLLLLRSKNKQHRNGRRKRNLSFLLPLFFLLDRNYVLCLQLSARLRQRRTDRD